MLIRLVALLMIWSNMAFAAKAVLTEAEATMRSAQVADLKYRVSLDLTSALYPDGEKEPLFVGTVEMQFMAKAGAETSPIFVDFTSENDGEILGLHLNGKAAEYSLNQDQTKIYLKKGDVIANSQNNLKIDFKTRFSHKGKGFHREVDPSDKLTYVYTNLEPFFANEVFPLFDQPDLKGSFEYEITAPSSWTVVTNSSVNNVMSAGDRKIWTFHPTPKMSSYLIGISAGPWAHFAPKEQHHRVPLALYSRQSLAPYIDSETWFDITKVALAKYEEIFGFYPYEKYDQLIVPGTASGAMESLAAITFNEAHVVKGSRSKAQKSRLAETLIHEMAHQWFGNLVTMRWWDDLWLNESFATFMSAWMRASLGKKLGLIDSWGAFFADEKITAYRADSYSTTHPIVMEVENTNTGFANFDSITYDKGASLLKQLFFKVGEEGFFNGIRTYFEKYREQNATKDDFIAELSAAAGIDLNSWSKSWLETSGTNAVQAMLDHGAIVLKQFPDPISQLLREHKTTVGFFNLKDEKVVLTSTLDVEYAGSETTVAYPNPAPDFVFPNLFDHDFQLVGFDKPSLDFVKEHLSAFEDPLLKQQLYFSLWQMVRNGQWHAHEFVDLIFKHSTKETDISLLSGLYDQLAAALLYTKPAERAELNTRIVSFLTKQIHEADSIPMDVLFSALMHFHLNENAQLMVREWLNEGLYVKSLRGFELHQDRRWLVLQCLARSGFEDAKRLIGEESEKDGSERGIIAANAAQAALPNIENKRNWFKALASPNQLSIAAVRSIGSRIHDELNESLTDFVLEEFLNAVLNLANAKQLDRKTGLFIRLLYPTGVSAAFDAKVLEFASQAGLSPLLQRALRECAEDSEKILAALSL